MAVKSFISVTENRDRGQSGIAMVTMEASHDTITTKHNQAVPGILPNLDSNSVLNEDILIVFVPLSFIIPILFLLL